jgi:host factor-I protein
MNKTQMNLQDIFLNQVRKEGVPVTIYLTGGVQLKGMVKGFDAFTVVLESPGKPSQLIYKHAIASVVPMKQINMRELGSDRDRPQRPMDDLPEEQVEPAPEIAEEAPE